MIGRFDEPIINVRLSSNVDRQIASKLHKEKEINRRPFIKKSNENSRQKFKEKQNNVYNASYINRWRGSKIGDLLNLSPCWIRKISNRRFFLNKIRTFRDNSKVKISVTKNPNARTSTAGGTANDTATKKSTKIPKINCMLTVIESCLWQLVAELRGVCEVHTKFFPSHESNCNHQYQHLNLIFHICFRKLMYR